MTSLKLIDFSDVRGMRRATKRNQNSFWSSYGVSQSGGSRYESGREIPASVKILIVLHATGKISDDDLANARKAIGE